MAKMKTPIGKCVSEGEKIVWKYFKENFSDDYCIWMNCALMVETASGHESNEIDLILYNGEIGILVFSVKDWRIEHISQFTKNRVVLSSGQVKGHPLENAKQHRYCIQSKLKKKEFLDESGRPQLSVNAGVIFPYIDKDSFLKKLPGDPIDYNLPLSAVLFCHDLTQASPLSNPIQQKVRLRNVQDKRYRWATPLSQDQLDYLDELLTEPLDDRSFIAEVSTNDAFTRVDNSIILKLDNKQKELAGKYLQKISTKPGHSLIKGVAGSGKTILLQFIFAELAKKPEYKILMVVFNRALRDFVNEALEELGIPMTHENYRVETFFGLFGKQWPSKLEQFRTADGWYDEERLDEFISQHLRSIKDEYDFVLIDEGQDFRDTWIKMIIAHAKAKGNVVYTQDFEQNLYGRNRAYIDAGLEVRGQGKESSSLLINYRNTKQISQFALALSEKENSEEYENRSCESRDGKMPDLIIGGGREDSQKIWNKIKEWEDIGYEPGSIAIIYFSYPKYYKQTELLPGLLDIYIQNNKKLNSLVPKGNKNVPFPLFKANMFEQRPMHDIELNKLTTLQTSKGLDFDCVVLVVDKFTKTDPEVIRNFMYVGMTRARSELLVVMPTNSSYAERALTVRSELLSATTGARRPRTR